MEKINAILREVGIITLKFSKLESLTLEYISILISGSVTLTNYMIFQDQTLDKKLQTLEMLIHLKSIGHREKLQIDTINKIKKLKNERNLFIHGDWGNIRAAIENDFETISVQSIKYNYKKDPKSWTPAKKDSFTIERFKIMNEEIDHLLVELSERIKENENK